MDSKPVVKPFLASNIFWAPLAEAAKEHLNVDLVQILKSHPKASPESALITALTALKSYPVTPWDAQCKATTILQHILIGFVIICDDPTTFLILESTLTVSRYPVKEGGAVLVASGSLRSWVNFVVENSQMNKPYQVRYIADCVYLYLKSGRLADLFCEFTVQAQPDKTFTLIPRHA